jgi:predicted dinucleotide-binding enzyme
VILAVPWKAVDETALQLGTLDGRVVIDITVPYGKEVEALGSRSSGEVIQRKLRGARVVKAWSHVFAKFLTDPEVDGIQSSVLIAGDDEVAKDLVSQIARDMRFHPVDVGRLRQSQHLDRLVSMMLFVKLGRFRILDAPP